MIWQTNQHLEGDSLLRELERKFGQLEGESLIRAFYALYSDRIALVSSFGAESAILLRMVANVHAHFPVVFLDTGKHFSETLSYRKQVCRNLGLSNVIVIRPDPCHLAADDPTGELHELNPDLCCHVRKTIPLIRVLRNYDCWITGRKQFQSSSRGNVKLLEHQDGKIKINPLATWSAEQVRQYISNLMLIQHPLLQSGYRSIGCQPCTRATVPGEDSRAGRWSGQEKTECGIHFEPDESGQPSIKRTPSEIT